MLLEYIIINDIEVAFLENASLLSLGSFGNPVTFDLHGEF
jgi:hypothetical protein